MVSCVLDILGENLRAGPDMKEVSMDSDIISLVASNSPDYDIDGKIKSIDELKEPERLMYRACYTSDDSFTKPCFNGLAEPGDESDTYDDTAEESDTYYDTAEENETDYDTAEEN